jgi:cytochrome c-type biogenesis protein CcmH/NrfG
MSRRASTRSQRTSRSFTILAAVIVGVLLLGGAAAIISDRETDSGADRIDAPVRVTPGAEVARLETAVAHDPDDVESIVVLAEVLANSGRISEAIGYFERAVALRPDDPNLRIAFGQALERQGSAFDAELQYRRAAEADPPSAPAAYYLARLLEQQGDTRRDEAVHWYHRVVELEPDSFIAETSRARLDELTASDATPTAE